MKKLVATIASTVLALSSVSIVSATPASAAVCTLPGLGTSSSPWLISSQSDLLKVGNDVGGAAVCSPLAGNYFRLEADIALTGDWTPLDFSAQQGAPAVFDGQNHTISGLRVVTGLLVYGMQTSGLFGRLENATVKNLKVTGTTVYASSSQSLIGTIAGMAVNSDIENVHAVFTGTIGNISASAIGAAITVGGLIGQATDLRMKESTFHGTSMFCSNLCGGAVGEITASVIDEVSIKDVGVRTAVTSNYYAGGLVGRIIMNNHNVTISGSFAEGVFKGWSYSGAIYGTLTSYGNNKRILVESNGASGSVRQGDGVSPPNAFALVRGRAISFGSGPRLEAAIGNYLDVSYTDKWGAGSYAPYNLGSSDSSGDNYYFSGDNLIEGAGPGRAVAGEMEYRTSITSLADLTNRWTYNGGTVEDQTGVKVNSASVRWVLDTKPSGAMNEGRPMPAALYNLGFFGAVRDACSIGTFSSDGGTPCAPVPAGSYGASTRAISATLCQPGTYQNLSGQSACIPASAGYFVSNTGEIQQNPCPAGYTSAQQAITCLAVQSQNGGQTSTVVPTLTTKEIKGEPGQRLKLEGKDLTKLTRLKVGNKEVEFTKTDTEISFVLPPEIAAGPQDLAITWADGSAIFTSAVTVIQTVISNPPPIKFTSVIKRISNSRVSLVIETPGATFVTVNGKIVKSTKTAGTMRTIIELRAGKNSLIVYLANKPVRKVIYIAKK